MSRDFYKEMHYFVALEDGTVGRVPVGCHPAIGQVVTVDFNDENGNRVQATGKVVEFIEALPFPVDWDDDIWLDDC